ncbi:hypothetical protein VB834_02855 [Limnoraphis robusta Tam1]|nr:hypothetical protein [Limnoraphis robusta]MEA5500890.1 hypothetical protein [Limnoraphis robusta BA-68 BA1]MEA5537966.1 hypothetical protein [Limnoraphis robusta Tam1]
MNTTQIYQTESSPLIVQLHPVIEMTDEQFFPLLGWLIDPIHQQVYIDRPPTQIECL